MDPVLARPARLPAKSMSRASQTFWVLERLDRFRGTRPHVAIELLPAGTGAKLFRVSGPDRVSEHEDAAGMLDDLEKRYPA
jgi:hypothetical protein